MSRPQNAGLTLCSIGQTAVAPGINVMYVTRHFGFRFGVTTETLCHKVRNQLQSI